MTNISSVLFVVVLATSQVACKASDKPSVTASPQTANVVSAPNVSQYAARQGWALGKSKNLGLPVTDIAPMLYTAKGDLAPSCGLLAQTTAGTEFFEMLSPEQGVGFPQCLAVNDAAAFNLRNRQYLVFEYINRDTKEDFYRQYFYLYRDAAGRYVADNELNDSPAWTEPLRASHDQINAPGAEEGVRRAMGTTLSKSIPGMQFLERDFMAGQTSAFAAFHDKTSKKCTFVVDTGGQPRMFDHVLFANGDKCETVLAASKLEHAGTTYYLALFKGARRNHVGAVSVAPDRTIAAEGRLSIAAAKKSALGDMKTAKEAFKSAL